MKTDNSFNSRSVFSWALYDWASSAFPTIVLTFVFATYFTESVATNKIVGTSQWGNAVSLAGIIIAILSPLLGSIADYQGRRKPWLLFFTLLCIIAAALFWFVKPSMHFVNFALLALVLGSIGLEIGMVFYNSMLEDIAPRKYIGRFSGWGWGLGYFGGLLSLIFVLYVFIEGKVPLLHWDKQTAEHIRICGPFVALWIIIFSWPLFVFTHDRPDTGMGFLPAVKKGMLSLRDTILHLKKFRNIFKFILARIFFIDGLNTIFAFGGIYAAGTFNMDIDEVIKFGIMMNVGAGIGSLLFGWLDDYLGSKKTLLLALFLMMITGWVMVLTHSKITFWIVGMMLSMNVGPIQASSRSLMIHLAPKKMITEMFGLFALSGKVTSFVGPLVLASATEFFNSQRVGISTTLLFLLIGTVILMTVKSKTTK